MKKYKAAQSDFEFFKQRCGIWLEVLSLQSWKIYYEHTSLGDVIANCSTDYEGRVSTIRLNSGKINVEITRDLLCETALHECLELLLSPMMSLAQCRSWDPCEYDRERHSVIRVLEKLLRMRGKSE